MVGWTENMERLALANAHKKANDVPQSYYLNHCSLFQNWQRVRRLNQKKALEFNSRHSVLKELLQRVDSDPQHPRTKEIAELIAFTEQDESDKEFEDFSQEPSDSGVEEEIGGDDEL
jgi:heat shock protein 90kDa beta